MFDCAFCRTPLPDNDAAKLAMIQARVSKKDPEGINFLGEQYFHGGLGLKKNTRKAFELYTEAAELGSTDALFSLGTAYRQGHGVQQDEAKAVEFFAKAAMQGHVITRHNLGGLEGKKGNFDRSMRHYLISAKMGYERSSEVIKKMFMAGLATKEQYSEALKGYQDAVNEMKSNDRDEAKVDSRYWKADRSNSIMDDRFLGRTGPWGPLPAGGLDLSKTLQPFAANHGQTYRGRALLVENFQRAETAKP
ncbi:hypothetical protein THAOC_07598, partial [Thalassiosira oceanica]